MAVKLTPVGKTSPEQGGKGDKKYYAQVVSSGIDTTKDIIQIIEKTSTVSGADVKAVLFALTECLKSSFEQGRIVQLDDLGSFRLSVSSTPEDDPSLVGPKNVKQARVVYHADKDLKKWLNSLKFTLE
jgi:predicted histone-like DNA-binding protein